MGYTNYYAKSGMFHASLPLIMHTGLDVLLFGKPENQLNQTWLEMEREIKRLEKIFNRFDRESEVAKVNTDAQFRPVELSDDLWNMMSACRDFYAKTDGNFDVTFSNFQHLIFTENAHSVQFNKYGMFLDFGGIAKGYALNYVHKIIQEADIQRALINFGDSSVLAVGRHPHGETWSVVARYPFNDKELTVINLVDTSLSVSGNSPQNPNHIYSPENKDYITGNGMVAVVTDNPVEAEAITTAWLASGKKEPAWLQNF
ncbi:MAG: FAD:protein FMN transferase, partial [Tannerella sp.]|nr:FAD:protein FMN transferase [Tannerella sp.]